MTVDAQSGTKTAGFTPTVGKEGFSRHRGPVTGVAAVPGSSWVATSAYDGAVALFNLSSHEVQLLGYHRHLVNRIVVHESGSWAASCSSDYTTCIWDLDNREPGRILRGHSDDVEDFVFADGNLGVSASRDHRVMVWDLETGAIVHVLDGHEKDVLALAYHDGRIYSSGDDMTLRVWDLKTGELLKVWGPFEMETDTCAIDPLHRRAVLGCDDGFIRVFDSENGELVKEIAAHSSGIKKVAVSPVTGDILSAAYDQKMVVWDAETLEEKRVLEKQASTWERSISWSSGGDRLLAGTFDGTVLVWDASSGLLKGEIGGQSHAGREVGNPCFNEVAASGPGEVSLVSDDGYVRLAHLTTTEARLLEEIAPASGRMLMNAITSDAERGVVACGAHDHKIHIFDNVDGHLRNERQVFLGEGPINTIRIARHDGYSDEAFVGCYSSAIVRVALDGTVRGKVHVHEGAVKALRLHPRETVGVSCGADGLLLSWTFGGEVQSRYLGHTAIINDVDLEPSGERLASVSRDFSIKIYDFANGQLLETFALGRRSLKSVCFFDADTLVVGDYWGSLIKVDLNAGRVRRAVIARNGISSVTRSGAHVLASSYDGGVYLVDPEELKAVNAFRSMDQRVREEAVV